LITFARIGRLGCGMEFRILGPVEVWDGAQQLDLGGSKPRALLTVLLLHANQVVSTDYLIDQLWGEAPPPTARNLVQIYVSHLRQALYRSRHGSTTDQMLVTRPSGYQLRVEPGELDLDRFQGLSADARRATADGDLEAAAERWGAALALWRGPALAGAGSEALQRIVVPRLQEARLVALEERLEAELGLGRHVELVGELEALMAAHPDRERLCRQLMLALYRSGRPVQALGIYRSTRQVLVEELGLEPSRALQELERAILLGDPALHHLATNRPGLPAVPSPPIPRELPGTIAGFTGRTRELQQLSRLLTVTAGTAGRPVIISAIDGMGGIGKSALAIQAANQLADRFPDGQLYINLHGATPGQRPLPVLSALGQLLRSLGLDPAAIPTQVDEAAVRLRSLAADRRLLILLDNAHSAAQVHPMLPSSPTCAVLVTSRRVLCTLEGAHLLHLDLLPREQALQLLGRFAGLQRMAAEPAAAEEVVQFSGRLPLAIRIAGARLAARPTWPISELAGRLADAAHRLEELTAEGLAVGAAFDVSLEALQHSPDPIDQAAAAAFGLLSLPDGHDLDAEAAARLLGQPDSTTQTLLERLVDTHLMETRLPGRYQLHDLVRLHARQHASQQHTETERLVALSRLFGFYTATAWNTLTLLRPGDRRLAAAVRRWTHGGRTFASVPEALCWLEAERTNMLAAIAQVATVPMIPTELAGQLALALHGFFSARSYWEDGVQANQVALQLALSGGDRDGQAHAYNELGVAYEFLGRYQQAIDSHQASLTIRRELGDRGGQAASLNNLGRVYELLGSHQEAITSLQESLTINRGLGHRRGQASSLGNLGHLYTRMGRYQEALTSLQESLTAFRELGEQLAEAAILSDFGRVYERMGRYQEAITSLQGSLTISRDFGDLQGQADSLNSLGRVYRRLGRYQEAINCHQDSLALSQRVNDLHIQVEALRDLGDVLDKSGRAQQARANWQEALVICEALQIPETAEVRERLTALPSKRTKRTIALSSHTPTADPS
jgi:DNA-binding SARP family transcriptional activator